MSINFIKRLLTSLIIVPLIIFLIFYNNFTFNFLIFSVFLIGFVEIIKLKENKIKLIISFIFLIFIISIYYIKNQNSGIYYLILILLISSLSDTGGYLFGKLIGGKKIKYFSPNKTYSGFFGSLLITQFSLVYIYFLNINLFKSYFLNIIFLLFSSIIVILGDLIFSHFKRMSNIKDFSNVFPGHGGLFDRIDGLIFLTIFFNLYLII